DEKKPGGAMGTPDYISPEQIQALPDVDIRSDLYALGGTLFHMLTGHPPFSGDPTDVMARHLTEPFPDPRDEVPELSEGAVAILRRLTEKRREDRYQTPAQAIGDLETALAGGDVGARQTGRALASRRVRRSQRFNLGVAGVVLAAMVLAGLLVLALTSGGDPPPEPPPDKPPPRKIEPDPEAGKFEQEARKAEEALANARRFRKENPEDFDKAVRLFQEVAKAYSSDWQAIALDEIAKVRDARERRAEELAGGPLESAAAEAGRERFGDAQRLLRAFLADRKAVFGETRAYGKAQDALRDLASRADAFAGKLETEARQAVSSGHFDAARSAAERIRSADPEAFGSRAEAVLREAAEEERKRTEAAQEREALDLLAQARGKARDSVRAGKVMEAVEAFENVRSTAKSAKVWRLAQMEAEDLDRLAEFWKALGEAKDAAGREITVGGKTGKVTTVSGGYVHILLGPARTAFRLQELKTDEVVRLAEIGLLPADAKWKRGLAVYCLYQDRAAKANDLLKGIDLTEEEREFYRGKAGG
ncbi:MAG: hypothetical protein MUC63_03305, partial [Planctomycetes bacterium]|nr:hypothetical protein [Planctomycetota bacterium]